MSLGPIRISSQVGRGAQAPSSAGRLNIQMPTLRSGNPFAGAEQAGRAYQELGHELKRIREREIDEQSAEIAQKEQAALSDFTHKLYERKEEGAAGVVDAFDAECQKAIKEAGATMNPATRKAFERRMAPWIAGRRENLWEYQYREVKRGRVNALENDMRTTATTETNDIISLLGSEQADWDDALAKGIEQKDEIEFDRQNAFDRHFTQMLANQQATETRYNQAVSQGLFGPEEAKQRCQKSRLNTTETLLNAAIRSENADFAEYTLNKLTEGKGKDTLAAKMGLDADTIAGYRSAVQGIRKRKTDEADAKVKTAEKNAISEDVDTFNKTVVDSFEAFYTPPFSKEEKLAELSRDRRLSPSARQQRMHQWASWFDNREKEDAERKRHVEMAEKDLQEDRSKNGYEMQIANGKSVWISASRWGQTQADLYHWFSTDAIARDPVMAIARAEALKATGSISREDYTHTIATATAFQSPKVVEAANRALGGNFFTLVDTKKPKKSLPDYTDEGADFSADLAYKYDPKAKTGFTGSFQTRGFFGSARPSSLTADMRQLDKTGEKLFTPEEKTALFREIGWMVSRDYTPEQIDASVQRIVAPKMQLFYNMTMQERLANPTFLRQLRENVTSFDDTVSAIVSKNTDKPISKVKNAPEE